MNIKKIYIHTHHIASHFTNGLWPVGALLLTFYFITGESDYEIGSFFFFLFSLLSAPVVFISGILDWKSRFKARSTHIFNHKRIFGVLCVISSLVIIIWRVSNPSVAQTGEELRFLYLALVYLNLGFISYLGHLGGKFI